MVPIKRSAMGYELHHKNRIGWLRAATLGANDGLISTSSLVMGVASAELTHAAVLLAAVAGLVAEKIHEPPFAVGTLRRERFVGFSYCVSQEILGDRQAEKGMEYFRYSSVLKPHNCNR